MKTSVLLLLILACSALTHVGADRRHKEDSSWETRKSKKKPEETCFCSALFDPVCGDDGDTYANLGCAACSGAKVDCVGLCPCNRALACSCLDTNDPVCGWDGKDYPSPCEAGCAGAGVACKGKCPCGKPQDPDGCVCPEIYAPVCSTGGETFENECSAKCAGAIVECDRKCPCQKACAQVQCLVDPCEGATCPGYPKAKCVADYCGGCNKNFYINGKIVNCDDRGPGCICPKNLDPVCGTDNKGYNNPCEAKCAGVEVECKGKCPCKCQASTIKCAGNPCDKAKCPAYPDATCVPDYCKGCDAVDFKINDRIVDCEDTGGCVCTQQYDPVCGVDGKTYGNACTATCGKIDVACEGECPCKPKCNGVIVQCLINPCDNKKCPVHPTAKCQPNYCNKCSAEFFLNGAKVDCNGAPKCSAKEEECEFSYGLFSKYSGSKKECCGGLRCCRCNPVERGMSLYFDNHGICLPDCTQCEG